MPLSKCSFSSPTCPQAVVLKDCLLLLSHGIYELIIERAQLSACGVSPRLPHMHLDNPSMPRRVIFFHRQISLMASLSLKVKECASEHNLHRDPGPRACSDDFGLAPKYVKLKRVSLSVCRQQFCHCASHNVFNLDCGCHAGRLELFLALFRNHFIVCVCDGENKEWAKGDWSEWPRGRLALERRFGVKGSLVTAG